MGKRRKLPGIVSESSSSEIRAAALRLDMHLQNAAWLDPANHFLQNTAANVDREVPKGKTSAKLKSGTTRARQLAEFVAASVVLHCADGWSYLGRAQAAQLRGDVGAARHLAYYAELRAAMSLLASEGIGVFDAHHVIVKSGGAVDIFTQAGTHQFAGDILTEWSKSERSAPLVTELIRPAGVSLNEWLAAFTQGAGARATGEGFLKLWGFDVEYLGKDHAARAEASYTPRTAQGCSPPPSARAVEFGAALWRALAPEGNASFGILDLHLLRLSLERSYRERTNMTPKSDPSKYRRYLESAVSSVPATLPSDRLMGFLSREYEPEELLVLSAASKKSSSSDPENHLRIMARAALLLRLSSGCSRSLLTEASLDSEALQWWSDQVAVSRALIEPDDVPLVAADLWTDVDDALDQLGEHVASGGDVTYAALQGRCSRELSLLGGCERIALTGLAA
jgi:hypothetical protein